MINMPKKAMVLAAGVGKRLRPLTDHVPKPLLQIAGKPLIDWSLDHLKQSGIEEVIINTFHHADKLKAHLSTRLYPKITYITEEELLGTGGAVHNALPLLGNKPFFLLHSNIIWINKSQSALKRLSNYWDDSKMDVLALITDKTKLPWHKGKGDFVIEDTDYRLARVGSGKDSPIISAGIYLIHPRLFEEMSDGAYPITTALEMAHKTGRFYGLTHQGDWYGVNTTEEYNAVNRILSE